MSVQPLNSQVPDEEPPLPAGWTVDQAREVFRRWRDAPNPALLTGVLAPLRPWLDYQLREHYEIEKQSQAWLAKIPKSSPYQAELTRLSDITPKAVRWLWKGRIPLAALTIGAGREGCGKSQFAALLSASVTTGQIYGFRGDPRSVIYISSEDSYQHTITPRLIVAGADMSKVYRLRVREVESGKSFALSLPVDNDLLEQTIKDLNAGLVVFDPLLSSISSRINANQGREVRQALDPLSKIAEDTGCAFWGIMHFSKAEGRDAASMIAHSGAFKDVARAIFGFAMDSEDTGVVSQLKNSLGPMPSLSETYQIVPWTLQVEDKWASIPRFTYTGTTPRHVENLMDRGAANAVARARDFLLGSLASGPKPAAELIETAREAHDIAEKTLRRAKADLNLSVQKMGGGTGRWYWGLRKLAA